MLGVDWWQALAFMRAGSVEKDDRSDDSEEISDDEAVDTDHHVAHRPPLKRRPQAVHQ